MYSWFWKPVIWAGSCSQLWLSLKSPEEFWKTLMPGLYPQRFRWSMVMANTHTEDTSLTSYGRSPHKNNEPCRTIKTWETEFGLFLRHSDLNLIFPQCMVQKQMSCCCDTEFCLMLQASCKGCWVVILSATS